MVFDVIVLLLKICLDVVVMCKEFLVVTRYVLSVFVFCKRFFVYLDLMMDDDIFVGMG